MGTTRTFNEMLNQYLPEELLAEELIQRDYFLKTVPKDDNWKAGDLIVPFKRAGASSFSFGSLTGSTDISESDYQRGSITSMPELWGTMIFNQRDLQEHDGKMPESTFLRIIPDQVDDFMTEMKEITSVAIGSGPHCATLVGDGQAGGTAVIDHIDRINIGQKFILDDANSAVTNVYVTAVDVNTDSSSYSGSGTITVSATRGGAALDISAYTVAQSAKLYHPGSWDGTTSTSFTSVRQALLSAANGGSTTIHGKTKTASPILQAVNISGADITSTNILDKIFDAWTRVRSKGKGNANTIIMSFKHLGSCMKKIESDKSPFKVTMDPKADLYGWTEIGIGSVRGNLKIVAVPSWDDDIIVFLDWTSVKFFSNGGFRKRKSPEGKQYFEVRNTTGYQYILDMCFFGEMAYLKPGHNGILYSISY